MGCIIECERPCEGFELELIREIDERLESTGHGTDNREPLDCARVLVGTMGDSIALTLFGRQGATEIGFTIVAPHMSIIRDIARATMCKIFNVEVEQPPF